MAQLHFASSPASARQRLGLPHQKIYQAFNIRQCVFGLFDFCHELSFYLLGAVWRFTGNLGAQINMYFICVIGNACFGGFLFSRNSGIKKITPAFFAFSLFS
jgi:hypothetical protein